MKSWKEDNIPIKNLLLWDENPRFHDSLKGVSQKDLINSLLDKYKLEAFAVSVVKDKDLPQLEKLVIWNKGKKFYVLEGNRRTATYLALQNPKIVNNLKIRAKFEELKKSFSISASYKLQCVVTNTKDEGLKLVDRKHFQSNNEAAWGQYERDNFIHISKGSTGAALTPKEVNSIFRANLSKKVKEVDLPEDTIKKVLGPGYVTNLFRIIDSTVAQNIMGYKKVFENIEIDDEARFGHLLKAVVFNVSNEKDFDGNKINSRTLNKADDRETYLKGIVDLSNAKIDSLTSPTIGQLPTTTSFPVSPAISTKGTTGRSQPASYTRKKLISTPLTIKKNKKLNDIYRELKDLNLDTDSRYSIAVLFRVFIELSCEEYLHRVKPLKWKGSSLEDKFKSVLDDLEPGCNLNPRSKLYNIYNEASDNKNGFIARLHKVVHDRVYTIDDDALKLIWDSLELTFTMLYAKINK